MASEEIRKNLGRIFMGERDTTVEELHAMQEPALRERAKKIQEEDYLDRVRVKAADRAREILGAAYAERQKVLEEARDLAARERIKIVGDVEQLKIDAQRAYDKAAEELDSARAIREEAERIRDAARQDGLKQGMDQAGDELKVFRSEIGQSLARVLQAIDGQRGAICNTWCDEITELVRVAVDAGTSWIVQGEHDRLLRGLVMKSLTLLEDRAVITIRVNPEDEASVGDMFRAAREKVPELRQWIVTGDESIARGGLIAESGSGSVDCRRERFSEMVNGVLAYLSLPGRLQDEQDAKDLHKIVLTEVEKAALLAPPLPMVEIPDVDPDQDLRDAAGAEPAQPAPQAAAQAAPAGGQAAEPARSTDHENLAQEDLDPEAILDDLASGLDVPALASGGMPAGQAGDAEDLDNAASATPAGPDDLAGQEMAMPLPDLPDLPEPVGDPQPGPAQPARPAGNAGSKANPSLEELEEELFPLDEPMDADPEQQQILSGGGFLPTPGLDLLPDQPEDLPAGAGK